MQMYSVLLCTCLWHWPVPDATEESVLVVTLNSYKTFALLSDPSYNLHQGDLWSGLKKAVFIFFKFIEIAHPILISVYLDAIHEAK